MVLHPTGGSFEHLLKISSLIIVTHSIAIVSLPIILFGYWGLTRRLGDDLIFSTAAFITISFAMFAVLCAAAINGLVLPLFINRMEGSSPGTIESIRPIILYNTALNHAFDFIYIGATCAAVLLWSVAILRTKELAKWIAYFGIILTASAIILLISGFAFVNLNGFRVFIFGLVCWTVATGVLLQQPLKMRNKK